MSVVYRGYAQIFRMSLSPPKRQAHDMLPWFTVEDIVLDEPRNDYSVKGHVFQSDDCAVCMEAMDGIHNGQWTTTTAPKNVILRPCGHMFHFSCTRQLNSCPLCRARVTAREEVFRYKSNECPTCGKSMDNTNYIRLVKCGHYMHEQCIVSDSCGVRCLICREVMDSCNVEMVGGKRVKWCEPEVLPDNEKSTSTDLVFTNDIYMPSMPTREWLHGECSFCGAREYTNTHKPCCSRPYGYTPKAVGAHPQVYAGLVDEKKFNIMGRMDLSEQRYIQDIKTSVPQSALPMWYYPPSISTSSTGWLSKRSHGVSNTGHVCKSSNERPNVSASTVGHIQGRASPMVVSRDEEGV